MATRPPKSLFHIPWQLGVPIGILIQPMGHKLRVSGLLSPLALLHSFLYILFSVTVTGSLEVQQPPGDKGNEHEEDGPWSQPPFWNSQEKCSSGKRELSICLRIFCFAEWLHHECVAIIKPLEVTLEPLPSLPNPYNSTNQWLTNMCHTLTIFLTVVKYT